MKVNGIQMYSESNQLKKIQKIELNILNQLIPIFDKHDLKYYALGGTMLGAVRHQGFIPWDDDIDIGMPREDYEKFLNCYKKEIPNSFTIRNFKTDKSYRYYISRVQDTRYKVIEKRNENVEPFTFVSIDIFPLDGLPKNVFFRKIHEFRILYHRMKMAIGYSDTIDFKRKRNFFEKIIVLTVLKLKLKKIMNSADEKLIIDKLLKKYSFEDSYYFSNLMGAYRTREVFPKVIIENQTFFKFENIRISGIENYDMYLKKMYGEYLKIPNVEQIEEKVHFEIIDECK